MFVFRAGVVGAGRTGSHLAAAIAQAGIPVILCDRDPVALAAGHAHAAAAIDAPLQRLVAAGRLDVAAAAAQRGAALALLETADTLEALATADLVIEAVPEDLDAKLELLEALDAATASQTVLASSAASLSISELATAAGRPERVLGLHLPAAGTTRVVEVVEALETSAEAIAAATAFVAALRRTAVRCVDSPGFIVDRVVLAAAGELWRAQQDDGLDVAALDGALAASGLVPSGPFELADAVGLDTVLALVERLRDVYGERFFVADRLRALVAAGELGERSGRGFYEGGAARAGGGATPDPAAIVERFALRAFVEACLVLEEGVAGAREIDLALGAGAGFSPAPLAGADAAGLGSLHGRLDAAAERWGEAFAPPAILRRLIAQGRLGAATGQGFFPTPRPDPGQDGPVRLESRGEIAIAWLDNPPANSLSPSVVACLRERWAEVVCAGTVRALVIASATPSLFCAGADIKALAAMEAADAARLAGEMNALALEMGRSRIATIAAVGGLAYGGGCELAMIADVRIAGQSASFAQPEIRLGIMPGFGGTQRLPRLVGAGNALEMNLLGDPVDALEAWQRGLVNRVVPDHELLDAALAWARRLAAQAPLAVERIKQVANGAELEAGLELERRAFADLFASADAREGTAAFVEKRAPRFSGA